MVTIGARRRGHGVRGAIAVAALPLASVGIEAPAADASHGRSVERITFTEVGLDFEDFNIADIRADGSERRRLTSSPAWDIAPDYSPDGRRIAFTSGRSAPPGSEDDPAYSETYVMNADGSHVRRITFNRGLIDLAPAWSPDGRHLVVGRGPSDPEGYVDLWIINLVTGGERRLTDSPDTNEWFGHWSPDGRRIVFVGDVAEPGNDDIYSIRTDGTGLRRLTNNPALDADAHFSPDGDSIVFSSDRTGNFDVFVMRRDGSGESRITRDPSFDAYPAFSPDGRSIAFISERAGGVNDLFRMRADGSAVRNLTNTPAVHEFDPYWQP